MCSALRQFSIDQLIFASYRPWKVALWISLSLERNSWNLSLPKAANTTWRNGGWRRGTHVKVFFCWRHLFLASSTAERCSDDVSYVCKGLHVLPFLCLFVVRWLLWILGSLKHDRRLKTFVTLSEIELGCGYRVPILLWTVSLEDKIASLFRQTQTLSRLHLSVQLVGTWN